MALLSALPLASPLFAQDDELDPVVETDSTLQETVITGETPIKYHTENSSVVLFGDVPIIETPFSVAVITQDLIEDRRAFTAKEALQYEPSVSIPQGAGFYNRTDFAVRGFTGTWEGHFVDGLPFVKSGEPAIDDKQRIEVLKGPAGLRYGFLPPGGAINYVRKRPTPTSYTSISADVNTFGSFYSQIDHSNTVSLGDPIAVVPSGKSSVVDKNPVFVDPNSPTLGYRLVMRGGWGSGGDDVMHPPKPKVDLEVGSIRGGTMDLYGVPACSTLLSISAQL